MASFDTQQLTEILSCFDFPDRIEKIVSWGNGLINFTWRIYCAGHSDYLLQCVNTDNYPDIDGVMHNIRMVTDYIGQFEFHTSSGVKKEPMRLIPLKTGEDYYRSEDGKCYRLYNFLTGTYSIETAEKESDIYKAGLVLGQFHYLLRDFPADQLSVVVKDYHNIAKRYKDLEKAAEADCAGRAAEAAAEIDFFRSRQKDYEYFSEVFSEQRIPLCVNHNDTKINNIMFDIFTEEPLCMVDLDTLMPGFAAFDFGDAVRSVMCTGKEYGPDTDVNRNLFRLDWYQAYRQGFLDGAKGLPHQVKVLPENAPSSLTAAEEESLWDGARMIVLENAVRYLTDYLQGDRYFRVRYPQQNLVKTRMHIHLYLEMEGCMPA